MMDGQSQQGLDAAFSFAPIHDNKQLLLSLSLVCNHVSLLVIPNCEHVMSSAGFPPFLKIFLSPLLILPEQIYRTQRLLLWPPRIQSSWTP